MVAVGYLPVSRIVKASEQENEHGHSYLPAGRL